MTDRKVYCKANNPFRLNNPQTSDYDKLYREFFDLQDEYKELKDELRTMEQRVRDNTVRGEE